ncbi:MAG: Gfo/Idh/MocA family protein [Planctomycetaceae bacterium]
MPHSAAYGLLLISGAHTHQENYARAFAADGRCRIVGLCDEAGVPTRRKELNAQLAEELGVPVLDDLDAALARDDVQIVSVCADAERRGGVAAKCARAGKHVYIDKPIASSVAAARDVVNAVRENGVKSQMFSLVRSPLARRAREAVESGRLGELIGLHCELFFAKGIAGTADLSRPRTEKPAAERFTFLDSKRELECIGLYPLALFQWLTGGRVVEVAGSTANYFFAEHQQNDVEDFSCLLLRIDGGTEATITVGRTGWASHPNYGIHQVQLVGTRGTETIDAFRPRLEIYSDAEPWTQPATPHPQDPMGFWSSTQAEGGVLPKTGWRPVHPVMQSDAAYFLDCIEHHRESDVPAAVGAHAVEVIHAGYRAAAEGKTVRLSGRG